MCCGGGWRRDRDSNPGSAQTDNGFRDRRIRPLCHLSAAGDRYRAACSGQSRVLAYYMYEQALSEYGYRMGYGTAIATVLFFIMLVYIVFVLYRVYQQEKETD